MLANCRANPPFLQAFVPWPAFAFPANPSFHVAKKNRPPAPTVQTLALTARASIHVCVIPPRR